MGKLARKDDKFNVLVEFHKKKTADFRRGHREQAPDPFGISGCGLWYNDNSRLRLVGIMTAWKYPKEHLPLMMGTRIDLVRAAIE
ncbi:MAG: hypothetical protein K2N88_08950 [Muribaculaceae bacterium]|nr:hypothetical protein [Muribaculaceae bacterium]